MRKIILSLIAFVVTTCAMAQKITKSEFDKFNKCKHIETSWVNIRKNVMDLNDVNVMLYAFGGKNFLRFKINNTNTMIPQGAIVTLLSDNGETCDFSVSEAAIPEAGKGATSFMGSAKVGIDFLAEGNLDFIAENTIEAIRINTGDGYVDYDIKSGNAKKLNKAYVLFKKELDK